MPTNLRSLHRANHFAYMIISIALLGFGASGTALALTAAQEDTVGEIVAAASGTPSRRARKPARRPREATLCLSVGP
jgi:hypothetical protein